MLISFNGPDGSGKTTQIDLVATLPGYLNLGALHDHDPLPWAAAAAGDYARWWFEEVPTTTLTDMLFSGHQRRVDVAGPADRALLDRGFPMLTAVAAATASVKDGVAVRDALDSVLRRASPAPPPEFSILLLPAFRASESLRITSARSERPWTTVYKLYQVRLHRALTLLWRRGVFSVLIVTNTRSTLDVHSAVLKSLEANAVMPRRRPQTS